jgi:putative aldouronate transport system permease protein
MRGDGPVMGSVRVGGKIAVERVPLWKRVLRCWPLYAMLAPAIIYYILICYVPIAGNVLAFKDYSFRKGIWGSSWVGLQYFRTFFQSYDCWRLIRNTLEVGFIKCILEFPFAIILALLLNEIHAMKFKRVTQTITYLPHFLSSVIIVTMIQRILAPNDGVLNQIITSLGGDGSTFFLMKPGYFFQILFGMDIWRSIGWDSIIYLAAISSVDQELYEAAEMDGCNRLSQIWHVTLPGIRGTIGLLFIMGVGGLLSSGFDQIYLLRTPGNMIVADTLDVYVVRIGLQNGQFGYASAIGLIQGLVGLVLVVTTNAISKKYTEVGLW